MPLGDIDSIPDTIVTRKRELGEIWCSRFFVLEMMMRHDHSAFGEYRGTGQYRFQLPSQDIGELTVLMRNPSDFTRKAVMTRLGWYIMRYPDGIRIAQTVRDLSEELRVMREDLERRRQG